MRGLAFALLTILLATGCMSRPAQHDRSKEVSYNRRELEPSPGILSGPEGRWTIYDNSTTRTDPDPACEETCPDDEDEVRDPPAEPEP